MSVGWLFIGLGVLFATGLLLAVFVAVDVWLHRE